MECPDEDRPAARGCGYVPQARDTSEAVDRLVFDGLRRMTPRERLALSTRMFHAVERLCIAGLRARYPDATDQELRRRCGAIRLGPELTRRAFGEEAERWID